MNSNVTPDRVRDLARRLVATNFSPDAFKGRLSHDHIRAQGRVDGIRQAADALGIVPTPYFLKLALSTATARVTLARGTRPTPASHNSEIRAFDSAVIDLICEFVLSGEVRP